MVLLVPLAMYTLYLEDLLFYKINQEEAVVSAPWDAFHPDYRHSGRRADGGTIESDLEHFDRLTYADHTSAWNTYDNPEQDTDDKRHHQALAAHQCWLAKGGEQVTCQWQNQATGAETEPLLTNLNRGGVMKCWARLGVQNYFLPEYFLNKIKAKEDQKIKAKEDKPEEKLGRRVFDKGRWTGRDYHANALQDGYVFPRESSSIIHDPWALNFVKTTNGEPASGGHRDREPDYLNPEQHNKNAEIEWTPWVDALYKSSENQGRLKAADDFANGLISEFLAKGAVTDGQGDDVKTLPLAFDNDPTGKFKSGQGFNPSGYRDPRVAQTKSAMQKAYMGMDEKTW